MLQRYVSKELTHFVGRKEASEAGKYSLLVRILTDGLLTSHGMSPCSARDDIRATSINPNGSLSDETIVNAPSVCFCDIPVNDMGIHMEKYSRFGLSFLKSFLVQKRANPAF